MWLVEKQIQSQWTPSCLLTESGFMKDQVCLCINIGEVLISLLLFYIQTWTLHHTAYLRPSPLVCSWAIVQLFQSHKWSTITHTDGIPRGCYFCIFLSLHLCLRVVGAGFHQENRIYEGIRYVSSKKIESEIIKKKKKPSSCLALVVFTYLIKNYRSDFMKRDHGYFPPSIFGLYLLAPNRARYLLGKNGTT